MEYKFSSMEEFIKELPDQILQMLNAPTPEINVEQIEHLIIGGMGGSGIVGDLISRISTSPVYVIKDYTLPYNFKNSLYILISYSGNTEETLSLLQNIPEKAPRVIVTSGGKLKKHNFPCIALPKGYPPRCALGYILTGVFKMLSPLLKFTPDTLRDTALFLKEKTSSLSGEQGIAFELAQKFYRRLIFLYTGNPYFPAILRWKTQINENAKASVHIDILPEMNHNEIVGLTSPRDVLEETWSVFITGEDIDGRNRKRTVETQKLLEKVFIGQTLLEPEGKNYLERLLYLLYLGDWISLHLAKFYQVDPFEIKRIELLKKIMEQK